MLIFIFNFGNSSMLQCHDNCFSKFVTIQQTSMVHMNIHFSNQGISNGTYKHSFFTPRHITWYIQTNIFHTKGYHMVHTNIHFAHQGMSHGTYEHTFCTPKHIALYTQNIHMAHQFTTLDRALRNVTRA